jgi:ribose 1,5-bisphosphokinase
MKLMLTKVSRNHKRVNSGKTNIELPTSNVECGRLFLVVGNSGSGKDALLAETLRRWPDSARPLRCPRRYITRPAHASEPFISITADEFENLKRRGQFCMSWHVYGTDYGVPAALLDWLEQGQHVIVNVSRQIIGRVRKEIPDARVIFVKVPFEITRRRMQARSRESESEPSFQQRLQRARDNPRLAEADVVIDNSGPLEAAADEMLRYLLSFY